MLDSKTLAFLAENPSKEVWRFITETVLKITSNEIKSADTSDALKEIMRRDEAVRDFDHFLFSCGWDLWQDFNASIERTSDRMIRWWGETHTPKAILILDGLSLREMPWLISGAENHGFRVCETATYASEIPSQTDQFAKALGFNNRKQLRSNGAIGSSCRLQDAYTESTDMPWQDCEPLINSSPNWVFWHHWPDKKIHEKSGENLRFDYLIKDIIEQLSSDSFWSFVDKLANGRELVITSDHGYAVTDHFTNADAEEGDFLKKTFAGQRNTKGVGDCGLFLPPLAIQMTGAHGSHLMVSGRWKWKISGGYPALTHGGLSLFEMLSPFVILKKS